MEARLARAGCEPGRGRGGLGADPWLQTMLFWEASLIAAADPRDLGLADWHLNLLTGGIWSSKAGSALSSPAGSAPWRARCATGTPARRIAWGDGVAVETPSGTHPRAPRIVTVSTGVLRPGAIAFDPPLPARCGRRSRACRWGSSARSRCAPPATTASACPRTARSIAASRTPMTPRSRCISGRAGRTTWSASSAAASPGSSPAPAMPRPRISPAPRSAPCSAATPTAPSRRARW